ncbi:MAG: hypothetical protein KBD60_08360 [Sterolibacterium sp.]|jgi:glycosyltransferase involved in cell wall biosynthesis|nr:hypothetical protein [Sterolibacterium sp.]
MLFLIHSDINASNIQRSLGMPEYSYYFVLKSYLDVLEELGTVIQLTDPLNEADRHFDTARARGEDCVFICFAPPHRAPVDLRCPTLCVFAWEFSNIPDTPWDNDPRNDWRFVLKRHGRTITLSSYTEQVIRDILGADFPVRAIPVPVYNKKTHPSANIVARDPVLASRHLMASCTVIDSHYYDIGIDTFTSHLPAEYLRLPEWRGDPTELSFKAGSNESGLVGGFYEPEPWGIWSRIGAPWVMLPFHTRGRCRLAVEVTAYGPNVGRTIEIELGGQVRPLPLSGDFAWHEYVFDFTNDTRLIRFSGLDTTGIPNARDPRGMGIGLRSIRIERLDATPTASVVSEEQASVQIPLDGVVYTSVFNPGDDRKNWGDMLTAFCYAFRDEPRAVLLLKMTHHALGSFLGQFHYLLQRIGPVQCRILILHGFLDDNAYRQLIDASTYCVNTSRCEGLCLPLMEFMSQGIPAISPRHTAMLDYVNANNTFIVASSAEPGIWPHDPRTRLHTLRQRIDWHSLVEAYQTSFRVALEAPARYRHMSEQAQVAQLAFCGHNTVRSKLAAFFNIPEASRP